MTDNVWALLRCRNSFHYAEDRNMPREESSAPEWTQQARIVPSVQLNLFE